MEPREYLSLGPFGDHLGLVKQRRRPIEVLGVDARICLVDEDALVHGSASKSRLLHIAPETVIDAEALVPFRAVAVEIGKFARAHDQALEAIALKIGVLLLELLRAFPAARKGTGGDDASLTQADDLVKQVVLESLAVTGGRQLVNRGCKGDRIEQHL